MPFPTVPQIWSSRGKIVSIVPSGRVFQVTVAGERGGASLTFSISPETVKDLMVARERDQLVEIRLVRAPKGSW
jgi:hypothetical protein